MVPVNRNNSNGYACEIKRTKPVSSTNITARNNKGKIMNTAKWIKKTTQEETNKTGERERASRLEQYARKTANKK